MNYGQKILFDFMCISLSGRKNSELDLFELRELEELIVSSTNPKFYDNKIEECPDHMIMVNPSQSFEIFSEYWDENLELIETIFNFV